MPWDSSRPVPWMKLLRQWAVYAAFLLAFFLLFFREGGIASAVLGVALSAPLFLGMNWVLYKLGRERKSFRELREQRRAVTAGAGDATGGGSTASTRPQPVATRRTMPGHNNPRAKKKRR